MTWNKENYELIIEIRDPAHAGNIEGKYYISYTGVLLMGNKNISKKIEIVIRIHDG